MAFMAFLLIFFLDILLDYPDLTLWQGRPIVTLLAVHQTI
jgi:hypothetical protein